jgi:hypothetical protein
MSHLVEDLCVAVLKQISSSSSHLINLLASLAIPLAPLVIER